MILSDHYLFPSTIFASPIPTKVTTILGSCVAVCLYDPVTGTGGINHFMLPFWNGEGLASPKYGNIANEKLIESMLYNGSKKNKLIAKLFGGANIFQGTLTFNVGQRNIDLATKMLADHGIPVVAAHVGGSAGRKIIFNTYSGEVLHQLLISPAPIGRI